MTTPYCQANPAGFLQPGEDPAWHLTPAAQAAIRACARLCPVPLEDCARNALTAGTIPGSDRTRVASGVIQAGIVCRGDLTTHQALVAIAYPHGGGPEYVTADGAARCDRCRREFADDADEATDTGQRVRRAVKYLTLCTSCYKRAWRDGALPRRHRTPDRCITCGRPMTTRHTPLPGHVPHEARGSCRNCVRAAGRQAAREGKSAA
ncbi:Uncharacterised protein [Mycobacteroides abscessus subsp. abscessus]|nr:Uncharacterised protein [Mycobacteroides abscessus subsp. abscessus]